VGCTARVRAIASIALVVGTLSATGCGDRSDVRTAVATRDSAFRARQTFQSGGEVANLGGDRLATKWLGDENVLAIMGLLNARQISAADVELQHWGADSVRAFAEQMARAHAAMQHAADSLAAVIHIAPVAPALAQAI